MGSPPRHATTGHTGRHSLGSWLLLLPPETALPVHCTHTTFTPLTPSAAPLTPYTHFHPIALHGEAETQNAGNRKQPRRAAAERALWQPSSAAREGVLAASQRPKDSLGDWDWALGHRTGWTPEKRHHGLTGRTYSLLRAQCPGVAHEETQRDARRPIYRVFVAPVFTPFD